MLQKMNFLRVSDTEDRTEDPDLHEPTQVLKVVQRILTFKSIAKFGFASRNKEGLASLSSKTEVTAVCV